MTNPIGKGTGPVSRVEIVEHLADAFGVGHAPTKDELIVTAVSGGAPAGVVAALQRLPGGRFRQPRDLWRHLPEVPIEA